MSLINEALKRTRDLSFQSGSNIPCDTPNYQISGAGGLSKFGGRRGVVLGILLGAIGLGTAGSFAYRAMALRGDTPTSSTDSIANKPVENRSESPRPAEPAVPEKPVVPSENLAGTPPVPLTSAETDPGLSLESAEEQLIARLLEKIKTEQAELSQDAKLPQLALQGITRDGRQSEAMINGYTVGVGDEVEGAQVTAIDKRSVKLQFGEQEIVLRMR